MSKARGLADLGNVYDDGALSNRNLFINGAMRVAQRGTSVTGITSSGYYTVDRYRFATSGIGTWTMSQSTDAPNEFASSLKLDCTTAEASPASATWVIIEAKFEGQDLQALAKGTSDAKPLTASFWVKCSKTGTFQASFRDLDNTRQVASNVTINSANTWEYKSFTLPADTTGAFDNDKNLSLQMEIWLDAGSKYQGGATPTSWVATADIDRAAGTNLALGDSTSNEFYFTGVQLEVGDTATPFEHRSYGDELQSCMRYFERIELSDKYRLNGVAWSTESQNIAVPFIAKKRAAPTITIAAIGEVFTGTWVTPTSSEVTGATTDGATINIRKTSAFTVKYGYFIRNQDIKIDAEL